MDVSILQLLDGARQAKGLAVVIDVFRAFSTACYALSSSGGPAGSIHPVAAADEAYARKQANPDIILMGERDCVKLPGFELGNSAAEASVFDFAGRPVIHTTSAGTQGLDAAANNPAVECVLTGSFVNSAAIVRVIRARAPQYVSLVAMGTSGREPSQEDDLCAERLDDLLAGRQPRPMDEVRRLLRDIPSAQKFFDPNADYAPEADFELCLTADRFAFALEAARDEDGLVLKRVEE